MKRRIGILGGTFDPPHIGHVGIAQAAYEQADLDEVLFMPSGTPGYKVNVRQVSDKADRCKMVELMIRDLSWCSLATAECDREGTTYTADTLRQLTAEHPDDTYCLIVGSDAFRKMGHWYGAGTVFGSAEILLLRRGNDTEESLLPVIQGYEKAYRARIRLIKAEPFPMNSTDIRKRLAGGEMPDECLAQPVAEYIRSRGLYFYKK